MSLDNVDFWWPRGYGDQSLYEATVRIARTTRRWSWTKKSRGSASARPASCRTETTSRGDPGEFVFRINKEKVFVRGTNWVPLDAFHSRDPSTSATPSEMMRRPELQHDPLLGRQCLRGPRVLRPLRRQRHPGLAGLRLGLRRLPAGRRLRGEDPDGGGRRRPQASAASLVGRLVGEQRDRRVP